jgi:hypothetical protein
VHLIYCVSDGLGDAAEFGRATWGERAVLPDDLAGFPGVVAGDTMAKVRSGKIRVITFSGVITEVETVPNGTTYVTVVDEDGEDNEFVGIGDLDRFRPGRAATLREVDLSGGEARPKILTIEIWLGD